MAASANSVSGGWAAVTGPSPRSRRSIAPSRVTPPRRYSCGTATGSCRGLRPPPEFAEAVKDWDRAAPLARPTSNRATARGGRIRLNAGMVAEAVAEFAELTKSSNWHADDWYSFACMYSVASVKVADKRAEYADPAMELLQKAVKAGFKDATHMKKDKDLDPWRC